MPFPIRSCAVVAALLIARPATSQTVSGQALVEALRHGGNVLVLRHASSPREAPDPASANADNPKHERQLDAQGRAAATAMGDAIRTLRIPIGAVLSSPTYRAMETVRLARFPSPRIQDELGDGGQSMQAVGDAQASWLKTQVTRLPDGTNTVLVTHQPNMTRAFPDSTAGLADGEALVFGRSAGGVVLIARVKIDEWPRLASGK
jgi:phosphohistidine phosphatase SixA